MLFCMNFSTNVSKKLGNCFLSQVITFENLPIADVTVSFPFFFLLFSLFLHSACRHLGWSYVGGTVQNMPAGNVCHCSSTS